MNKNLKYLGVIATFIALLLIYFIPLIDGKEIYQSDIINYKGGAKELVDFRENNQTETYWSNSMFSGMPTYQMGAKYPNDWIKKVDALLRFLPRPADYFFLLLLSSFILIYILRKNLILAAAGAILFAFSTYYFQIIEAGHNAKMHAIAYIPLIVAGMLLCYQRKYKLGFLLSALAWGLEIAANHIQMTYYLAFSLAIFFFIEGFKTFKSKEFSPFLKSTITFGLAALLGISLNAGRLITTYQFSKETTRGKSELTINKEQKTSGLDKDYITAWSYGKLETLNLWIPNFMGGGSSEYSDKLQGEYLRKAQTYFQNVNPKALNNQELQKLQSQYNAVSSQGTTYWGTQPFTSGPAYQGAIVIFLFILGLFLVKGPLKWWLLASTLLSFALSWGKNFMPLTDFLIDYMPLYNKFRAVSSALIIAEFTMPLLAVLAIDSILKLKEDTKNIKNFYYGSATALGLLVTFYFLGNILFPFQTEANNQMPSAILDSLKSVRIDLFKEDLLRTILFTIIAIAFVFAYLKNKLKASYFIIAICLLGMEDLWQVDKRYLNDSNFVGTSRLNAPFSLQDPINKAMSDIKEKDTSSYRVWNISRESHPQYSTNYMNESKTSYFHSSLGGYHGSKLKRYQELHDYHLMKKNWQVINMLNAKYILSAEGVELNDNANGNSWDIDHIIWADNANSELLQLVNINTKKTAVIDAKFKNILGDVQPNKAKTKVVLTSYKANELNYEYEASEEDVLIFSEIYYADGWNAYLDGKPIDHFRANYVLRAIKAPKGKHTIKFKFEPNIVYQAGYISLASFLLLIGLFAFFSFQYYQEKKRN